MSDFNPNATIWCLMDGKPGHQNQVLGLADGLSRIKPVRICEVSIASTTERLRVVKRSAKQLSGFDDHPALIIGAGHRSHLPLCILRLRWRSRSAVLMKPSLPLSCFDVCLIPSVHNLRTDRKNVIETRGVLNRVQPGPLSGRAAGIFLIGGPSPHYKWSSDSVLRQVQRIIADSDRVWTIATSRRTPKDLLSRLSDLASNATVVSPEDTSTGWLPEQLRRASDVWVTEDSVSMMYEALTSGAATGVIELQRRKDSRVTECTDSLVRDGDVTRWSTWRKTGSLERPARMLSEADRCAAEIVQRGFLDRSSTQKKAA